MAMTYGCCMLCPGSDREHQPEDCPHGLAYAERRIPTVGGIYDAIISAGRTAAMYGLEAPTPRAIAEEKVRLLLECDKPTKALAFTMLRNDGMDSDRAKIILRDAKWLLT